MCMYLLKFSEGTLKAYQLIVSKPYAQTKKKSNEKLVGKLRLILGFSFHPLIASHFLGKMIFLTFYASILSEIVG